MEIYSLSVLVAVTSLVVDLGLDCSPSLSKRIATLFIKGLIFIKLKEKHIVTIAFLVLLTVADIIEVEIFFHLVWIDVNLCEDITTWSLTLKVNGFVLRRVKGFLHNQTQNALFLLELLFASSVMLGIIYSIHALVRNMLIGLLISII